MGPLTASLEDYLEAILQIVGQKQVARAKDIASRLGVNSSSVTGALHALSDRKLVNYEPYGLITLTPEGKREAAEVVRRHEALRDFFGAVLGIEGAEAEEGACRIEHVVSGVILERLIRFVEFVQRCPRAGAGWIEGFRYFCEQDAGCGDCRRCVTGCLQNVDRPEKAVKDEETGS